MKEKVTERDRAQQQASKSSKSFQNNKKINKYISMGSAAISDNLIDEIVSRD